MIHGHQPKLIYIDHFFHRLHETEAQLAISYLSDRAVDLHIFCRIGNVTLIRSNPVPDHACANHVGDELIALAVPCK